MSSGGQGSTALCHGTGLGCLQPALPPTPAPCHLRSIKCGSTCLSMAASFVSYEDTCSG